VKLDLPHRRASSGKDKRVREWEMFYNKIFDELNKNGVKYLVIGGVAVNLHGYDRITGDIDIMISFSEENVEKFKIFAESLGFKPKVPVSIKDLSDKDKRKQWIEEKNAKVFSIYNPKNMLETIDVMIMEYLDFDAAYKKMEYALSDGLKVPLISIEDLIKLKEIAGRGRDITDIKALETIKELKNEKRK
jgi:predicted nucleotidyltransferase